MTSFWQILPPELQSTPGLVAGFLTLLGLFLCTAGIKVARALAAALVGGALATLAAGMLPALMAVDPWTSAVIGLALGLLIGAMAFRLVQGVILALCLSVLAAGAFYQWQITHNPQPVTKAVVLHLAPESAAGKVYAALPVRMQTTVQMGFARWEAIPLTLRQSMIVMGLGVAILAAFVAWIVPRPTTWLMSAAVGALMLLYGVFTLISAYLPDYARRIPAEPQTRLAILGAVVAGGMLIQWLYFWPGKREKRERAKDRPGELAPA
jgi:hypothetical protein